MKERKKKKIERMKGEKMKRQAILIFKVCKLTS